MEGGCIEHNVLESILDGSMEPGDLPLSLLEKITDNFSDEQKIGDGGFAMVYKGVLRNDKVAVKRIMNSKTIDETLFQREVNSLTQVTHRNIVRFLGFCSNTIHKQMEYEGKCIFVENRERLLCFEYINNGSLDKYITDELRGLEWNTRYNIIKGICNGLEYLHVNRKIVHMDLKPANILLDNDMMAKITDFGLSRMSENLQTITTNRFCTLGYCAPEYILHGKISDKYDVYSLGVIIIELVTGQKDITNKTNVLRRWRHRWKKSGQETPFTYQQVDRVIEIGLLCKENDPCMRPSISKIISDINELQSTYSQISSANVSSIAQISPYSEDDMLGIEPLELHFPIELNKKTSCPVQLTNETNAYIAFCIERKSPLSYFIQPTKGIVSPRDMYSVDITLQPLDKVPEYMQHTSDFIVRSTKVNESLTSEVITEDMFQEQEGKVVDEVNLTVVLAQAESKINSSTLDELIQFDPPELHFPLVPDKMVLSSFIVVNLTDSPVGLIMFSLNQQNKANYHVNPCPTILPARSRKCLLVTREEKIEEALNDMQFNDKLIAWNAIVPEDFKASDLHCKDVKRCMDMKEGKELPIVLTQTSLLYPSDELIQFDPPELSFPLLPNVPLASSFTIVNITDFYVGFCIRRCLGQNVMSYSAFPDRGILPPRSTQRLVVKRVPRHREILNDMQCKSKLFLCNMIVDRSVEAKDLHGHFGGIKNYKEMSIILKKTRPHKTNFTFLDLLKDELIRFHPRKLCFRFLPNKTLLSSVHMVNITDYPVGFCNYVWNAKASYYTEPRYGILPPQSTQKLVVKRVPTENEEHNFECKDTYIMWNAIVTQGVQASDLSCLMMNQGGTEFPNHDLYDHSVEPRKGILWPELLHYMRVTQKNDHKELPIVLTKVQHLSETGSSWWPFSLSFATGRHEHQVQHLSETASSSWWPVSLPFATEALVPYPISSCTSNEVIQIEPHELCFPILPIKSPTSSIKIVNITDYFVGFNTFEKKTNMASYNIEPPCGILRPRSTQVLMVTRVVKDKEALQDMMKCQDKYFLWSSFVNEDVDDIHLKGCTSETESKDLPIVFTEISSNDLIQFDPPELCLPLLSNKSVLSTVKIVNVTDHCISFSICTNSNSARYCTDPSRGILPPRSTQLLMVARVPDEKEQEDTRFKDKYLAWNSVVTEGVEASNVVHNMSMTKITELPIVLTEICSSTSGELIQFDPPELCFPFLPKGKVLSSFNIVNITDYNICFSTYSRPTNVAMYRTEPSRGILPPQSTQRLMVTREVKENELKGGQFNDKYFVLNSFVTEGVKCRDLSDYMVERDSMELPIVLTKISSLTSEGLILFQPPELCFPLLPNKRMISSVCIVNITDCYVAFSPYTVTVNEVLYNIVTQAGILSPRSTQKLMVIRVPKEIELDDMQCHDKLFVWSRIVTGSVKASDIIDYLDDQESKELPIVLNKTSLPSTDELIQFYPTELYFPFLPNKTLISSVFIVNITDCFIAFNSYSITTNKADYNIVPHDGILLPQSTQKLIVTRVPKEIELEDMQCNDKFFVRNYIVTEGVEASDIIDYLDDEDSKELPIVLDKTRPPCTSEKLIRFDPPELSLPFLPNKTLVFSVTIINNTDYCVGFDEDIKEGNMALYYPKPKRGIMPPQSTQRLVVRRVPAASKKEQGDTLQGGDKFSLWNMIVTHDIEASDLIHCVDGEDQRTELPIVLEKTSLSTSHELIQFDPPELRFPSLPNNKVPMSCSINIVNVTDHWVGFNKWSMCDNSACYHFRRNSGILPPRSMREIEVRRLPRNIKSEDMQCKDVVCLWNGIVAEGVTNEDLTNYMDDEESKQLPIVFLESGESSSAQSWLGQIFGM